MTSLRYPLYLTVSVALIGCAPSSIDLRTPNTTTAPALIYSAAENRIIGSIVKPGNWIISEIIRVDNKKVNPLITGYKFAVDPGTHEIEMRWRATSPPVNKTPSVAVNDTTSYVALGNGVGFIMGGNIYRSEKTFTVTINAKSGYAYYANITPSLLSDRDYTLPSKMCISEVAANTVKFRDANVTADIKAPNLICSK